MVKKKFDAVAKNKTYTYDIFPDYTSDEAMRTLNHPLFTLEMAISKWSLADIGVVPRIDIVNDTFLRIRSSEFIMKKLLTQFADKIEKVERGPHEHIPFSMTEQYGKPGYKPRAPQAGLNHK